MHRKPIRQKRIIFPDRTKWMIIAVCVIFAIIIVRLFDLQVINGDHYYNLAVTQRSSQIEIPASRGEILLRDTATGDLVKLATNTTLNLIYVDPYVTPDKQVVADRLAPLLFRKEDFQDCLEDIEYCPESTINYIEDEVEVRSGELETQKTAHPPTDYDEALKAYTKEIYNAISKENIDFTVLKRDLTDEKIQQVKNLNYPGIGINEKDKIIWADPTEVPEDRRKNIADGLAPILERDSKDIADQLIGGKLRYVKLKRKLDPDVSDKIEEIKQLSQEQNEKDKNRIFLAKTNEEPIPDFFRGVVLQPEHLRYYPDKEIAAQVIGFVNHEGVGQYGIEGKFNNLLAGKKGVIESQNDASGTQIGLTTEDVQDAENGASVVLTIDRVVQKRVEDVLAVAVKKYRADSGQVIIMEPKTGNIIAMANYPSFDPNLFGNVYLRRRTTPEDRTHIFKTTPLFRKDENDVLQKATLDDYEEAWRSEYDPEFYVYDNWVGPAAYLNKIVQETYEPGSVFKPLVMAIGLDTGEVTPSTQFLEDGPLEVGKYTIKTSTNEYRGWQTMTNVLETSSNVGMSFVAQKLGRAVFYKYLKDYGFGDYTDISLENEVAGTITYYKQWSDALLLTSSFGQGLTATPLQMATAWCALANGGILMKPHVVSEIIKDGETVEKVEPETVRRVISPDTSVTITAMLVSAVSNGVAKAAKVPGYKIAGKTGTSQIARTDGVGYEDTSQDGSVIATFGGYAPIDDPKFVILVKFDRPRMGENTWGATTAAPVFKELASFLFEYYGIPPDEE